MTHNITKLFSMTFKTKLKNVLWLCFWAITCQYVGAQVQSFSATIGSTIDLTGANGSCATPGTSSPNIIPITVSGVGTLSSSNAVTQIKVRLNNSCTGSSMNLNNLQCRLQSPNGTCVGVYSGGLSTTATGTHDIMLVSSTSCLNDPNANGSNTAGVSESSSSNYGFFNAQFNGTPTDLTATFNGENADGTWRLVFSETTTSEPCLAAATIVFGNPTVDDQTPNGDNCIGAIVWDGGAICAATNGKTGSVLMPGSLTGPNGTSFGTIGGVACNWNQANNNEVWLRFTPTSADVCISISGLDFSLQSVIVQDADEDGDNNPCTANPIGVSNDQRWNLISCPISSLYSTTAGTQKNQNHCFTAVVGQTYYLVVDGNGGAESPFYIGGVSGLPATEPSVCTAALSYDNNSFCHTGTATPTFSPAGGSFSAGSGLSINPTSGIIDLAASTVGNYTVTYTPSAADPTCFDTFDISILTEGFGDFASGTAISANGNNTVYNTTGTGADEITPGGANLNGAALGAFNPHSGSLSIFGGEIKTFKNIGNVCSATMYYRVYAVGSTAGAFTAVSLPTVVDCVDTDSNGIPDTFADGLGPCSPNDQKWKDYSLNIDLTNRCAGNYRLEVYYAYTGSNCSNGDCSETKLINNNGNNYIATFSINDIAAPSASVTQPTCSSPAATITATSPANGAGVSYTLAGVTPIVAPQSNTSGVFGSLAAGSYSLSSTISGCTSLSTPLTVNAVPTAPSIAAAPAITVNSNCGTTGNGGINISVSGGSSPYSYDWSNDGAETPDNDSEDLTNVVGGTYTVTVTGANGCSVVGSAAVGSSPALPSIAASPSITPNSNCSGAGNGGININVSSGSSPYTYDWSNDGSETPDNDSEDLTNVVGGIYTVTVTGANGCSVAGTATVNNNPALPSIGASPTVMANSNCSTTGNGGINISVSNGSSPYSYDWSNDGVETPDNDSEDLANVVGGTYTVTVTGANGCSATSSATVNNSPVFPLATAAAIVNTNCAAPYNGAVNLTSNGTSFVWNNGTTAQNITAIGAGTYTVTVTGANACSTAVSATVGNNLVFPASPTANINNVLCNGTATGAINITPSGGTATYTFIWSNGATTEDISGLAAGSYGVTVSGTNACSRVASYNVSQPTALSLSVTTNSSCAGLNTGSITAIGGGGTPAYTYQLLNGNCSIVQSNNTTGEFSSLAVGSYCVQLLDGNNCSTTQSNITIGTGGGGIQLVSSENTSEGNGGTSPFNYNTHVIVLTGGEMPYSFDWTIDGYVRYDISYTATTCIITIYYSDGAEWNVSIEDDSNCSTAPVVVSNITSVNGSLLDIYDYNITNTNTSAADGAIQIFVEGGNACNGTYYYEWATPSGTTINTNGSSPTTLGNQPSGWYAVTVSDCGVDGIHGTSDDQTTEGWYWIAEGRRGRNKTALEPILLQINPNPLQQEGVIELFVPMSDIVSLQLYNINGISVANLLANVSPLASQQKTPLAVQTLPTGLYTLVLTTRSGQVAAQQVLVVR